MTWKQWRAFWRFVWGETRGRVVLVVVLLVVLGIMLSKWGSGWWNWVDPAITLLTLGVALLVWFQQMREEWEDDYLPKRFTAHFYYEGKEVMRCENARLTSEGDIRALAQQIGMQMVSLIQLKFVAAEVEVGGPVVHEEGKYVHYTIKFKLTELPPPLMSDKRRVWREPFVGNNGKPAYQDEPL